MGYVVGNIPADAPAWMVQELRKLQEAGQSAASTLSLVELHVEPVKKPAGKVLIAAADGTDWNPGSGQGVYAYYGGAWHLLG